MSRISKWLAQTFRARRAPVRRPRRRMAVEYLEHRALMAANLTATLNTADGVLRIEGTPNNDQIHIHNEAGFVRVAGANVLVTNGASTSAASQVPMSQVAEIDVSALAGDDLVEMHENLTGGSRALPMNIRGGRGNDTIVGGSSSDAIYGGEVLDSTGAGYQAALLDNQWKFYAAGSEWYDYLGLNEKWFLGESGPWYYIKPNGEIFRSNASGTSVGTYLATVNPAYHANLAGLLEADSGQAAAEVDFQLGLYFSGSYYQNWGGKNEKWLQSGSGQWYFITPDGALYKQTDSASATGPRVTTLDHSYWVNPSKLTTAETVFGDRDWIFSGPGLDWVFGGGDIDAISGGADMDNLFGGFGGDYLYGEDGTDFLYGEAGKDTLSGGLHEDLLVGGDGNDTLHGDEHNDILWGGSERNAVNYTADVDYLYGDAGNDELHGGGGVLDVLYGGVGDDTLFGDGGFKDVLYGGPNNDALYGGAGQDELYGDEGDDGLFGGWADGRDTLVGGAGADRYLQPKWEVNFTITEEDALIGLAPEDAQVFFTRGDQEWTDTEVQGVDEVLGLLHGEVGNTKLLKRSNGGVLEFSRFDGRGRGWNNGLIIGVTDMQFDSPTWLRGYMLHEIGHNWNGNQLGGARWTNFQNISNWTTTNPNDSAFAKAAEQDAWYRMNTEFVSGYARNAINDDWAESFAAYFTDRAGWTFYLSNPTGASGAAAAPNKMALINEWVASLSPPMFVPRPRVV